MKKQVAYDMKVGILQRWQRYVPVCIIVVILCLIQRKQNQVWMNITGDANASFGNYLVVWLKGIPVIERVEEGGNFTVPVELLVLQIGYFLFLIQYVGKNLKENGCYIFLKIKKRYFWWLSKCIWVVISTVVYYGIVFGIIAFFSIVDNKLFFEPTSGIWIGDIHYELNLFCIVLTFVLPLLASISQGVTLILSELIISPVLSLVICCGWNIASIFWSNPILIGNYQMLCRNRYFSGEGNISLTSGIIVCAVICMTTFLLGYCYIKNYEFY